MGYGWGKTRKILFRAQRLKAVDELGFIDEQVGLKVCWKTELGRTKTRVLEMSQKASISGALSFVLNEI